MVPDQFEFFCPGPFLLDAQLIESQLTTCIGRFLWWQF